ncbi:phage tail protein [Cytobacillus kochii]|uniref:phage tail spike protein n=1 Tax=Cytobacillus kochii TaxID=859143 RepID=UPI001CD58364|nr:phage tail spike protein [Cytobacillus kochii]MCA1025791.1 phage tail protein [Cytobacillus kochii]
MLFILDKRYQTVGTMSNDIPRGCPYFTDIHHESLDNYMLLFDFETFADHPTASLIEVEGGILYQNDDGKHQLFKVKEIQDTHSDGQLVRRVYCENVAISELIGAIVRPVTFTSQNMEQIGTYILAHTGWEIGECEYYGVRDIEFKDHITALQALHQAVSEFGMEIEYEVIFNGTRVSKRLIHIRNQRGEVTKKIFSYGKDLIQVERTEDSREVVTALIGVGKGDNQGNLLTIVNYDGSAYLDKGYFQVDDYIYSDEAFQRYNMNGRHIFGIFKDDKATNKRELLDNTLARLKEISKPRFTYKLSVTLLEKLTGYEHEKVRLGDTVIVKDETFKPVLILEARVIELKRSKTDPTTDEVTLGDFIPIVFTENDYINKVQQTLFEKEKQWDSAYKLAEGTKEELDQVKNDIVYKVELHSSNGIVFRNGIIDSTLTARVYKGKSEITNSLAFDAFIWKKFDKNGILDVDWTNSHKGFGKQIKVTESDIVTKATFTCDVEASKIL